MDGPPSCLPSYIMNWQASHNSFNSPFASSKMLFLPLLLLFGLVTSTLSESSASSVDWDSSSSEENLPDGPEGTIWAVLVAGSNGFWNYRHQADVCHAWHILVNHGVDPEHIITMMYDDIAYNKENPHQGKIYNHPEGHDVYAGVRIDYKGEDVTPENFMAVLLGDEEKVEGKRVLKSAEADKVFVYFTDHGAPGLIGFPSTIMTVKNLSDTLTGMHKKAMYKELTFYLEACESGSMFETVDKLPPSMKIYAMTAANDHESSWGCYCETEIVPGNCLGDLFSVNWMEDSDRENLNQETLAVQLGIVRNKTTKSHVQSYGNQGIEQEHVSEFMGKEKSNRVMANSRLTPEDFPMYPSRDIPLFMAAKRNDGGHTLHILQKKRRYLERQISKLVKKVLHDPVNQRRALTTYPHAITQVECHHQVIHTFNTFCFNFAKNPYALKYVFVLTNLCEHRIKPERIQRIMMDHCADVYIDGIL